MAPKSKIGNPDKSLTAIEWLVKELSQELDYIPMKQWDTIRDLVEQAKQMEKEQIIDAHIEGQRVFDKHPHTQWTNDQAEQYYNDNYNK